VPDGADRSSVVEGERIVKAKADTLVLLPWKELDAYGLQFEVVEDPSGSAFLVKSQTIWDMDPWESDMYVSVQAHLIDGPKQRRWLLRRPRYWQHEDWRDLGLPPDLTTEAESSA
jgi:hypothetical protein